MSTRKRPLGVLFSSPSGSPACHSRRPETLAARSKLIRRLAHYVRRRGLTRSEAAERFNVSPGRISDLMSGRIGRFTAGTLINMCIRVGIAVEVRFDGET